MSQPRKTPSNAEARAFKVFFSPWRTHVFECDWTACNWSGPGSALESERLEEVVEFHCPSCGNPVLVLSCPTEEEIREAAKAGNPEAQRMLEEAGPSAG